MKLRSLHFPKIEKQEKMIRMKNFQLAGYGDHIRMFNFLSKKQLTYANKYRDLCQYFNAALMYRKFLYKNSYRFDVWVQLGHSYKESGLMNNSMWAYIQALRINTFDHDLWINIGHFFRVNDMNILARNAYIISAACNKNIDYLNSNVAKELFSLGGFILNVDVIDYMRNLTENINDCTNKKKISNKITPHQKLFGDFDMVDFALPFRMYENRMNLYNFDYQIAVSQLDAPAIKTYFNIFSVKA